MSSFKGPRLKLARAKHHTADLVFQAENFYRGSKSKLFIEDSPRTRERALCIEVDPTVPDCFPLIVGDAIHNLRSCLDHLTWDIVAPFAPPRPEDVQFPFCRKRSSFEGVLTRRQIHLAGEKTAAKFRTLEPYADGNELLYALHRLDIADKHQLIVPVRSLVGFDSLDLRSVHPSAPAQIIKNTAFKNIQTDKRLAVWAYDPSVPFTQPERSPDVEMTVQIMFATGQPLAGKSVTGRLQAMATVIEAAIEMFATDPD